MPASESETGSMACSLARRDLAPAVPASESETGSMACSLARRDQAPAVKKVFRAEASQDLKINIWRMTSGKKASCGSRSSYRRRQIWEESLLWVKKLTQEEINLERKPPMDQNTYKGGYNREERTSQEK